MEIAELIIEGKTGIEIATILGISRGMVKQHIRRMCRKADVENKAQIIVLFTRWKMANDNE